MGWAHSPQNLPENTPLTAKKENKMQDMQEKTVRILSMVASAFLFTAGVSLSVISCSKAIVREEEPGHENAITFSGVDTRAAVEDASGINEFSVWGYYTPEDASLLYLIK